MILTDYSSGWTYTISPHDFDDRGLKMVPGSRVKLVVSNGTEILLDKHLLQSVLDFMEKKSKEDV